VGYSPDGRENRRVNLILPIQVLLFNNNCSNLIKTLFISDFPVQTLDFFYLASEQ